MRKSSSFASCPYSATCKEKEPYSSGSTGSLGEWKSYVVPWWYLLCFSEYHWGNLETSHLGSEQQKWKKKGRNVTSGGCVLQCPCPVLAGTYPERAVQATGLSLSMGSMAAWRNSSSRINVLGFASVHYFCCWTPLNLFDLEVTDHLPSWEESSSTCCDLYKNLS